MRSTRSFSSTELCNQKDHPVAVRTSKCSPVNSTTGNGDIRRDGIDIIFGDRARQGPSWAGTIA